MTIIQNVHVQPKWFGKSVTIWGAFISLLSTGYLVVGPILSSIGVVSPVTPTDIGAAGTAGASILAGIGALIGLATTIAGRVQAGKVTQPITLGINAAPVPVKVVAASPSFTPQPGSKSSG